MEEEESRGSLNSSLKTGFNDFLTTLDLYFLDPRENRTKGSLFPLASAEITLEQDINLILNSLEGNFVIESKMEPVTGCVNVFLIFFHRSNFSPGFNLLNGITTSPIISFFSPLLLVQNYILFCVYPFSFPTSQQTAFQSVIFIKIIIYLKERKNPFVNPKEKQCEKRGRKEGRGEGDKGKEEEEAR